MKNGISGRRAAGAAGVPAQRRSRAVAGRAVGVPVRAAGGRPAGLRGAGLRRLGVGHAAGAVALAAARVRRARVHERALPVPGRPAARARREPDRRLPAWRSPCRRPGRGARAALRRRRLVRSRSWLNGVELGSARGQPAAGRVRRRGPLRPGDERARRAGAPVVVRVSYLEDQDMWWLSGIFRSVTLLARPAGGVDDVFVHADYDHVTGAGAAAGGRGRRRRAGRRSRSSASTSPAGETVASERVEPWSAELPRLYDADRGHARARRVRLRIGFRRVAIEDGLLHGQRRAACCCAASTGTSSTPTVGRAVARGRDAPRHRADEGAQRQRGPHARTTRRTRASWSCATSSGST